MILPCHETRQNIRSDEIKEDELIDIVSKEFWDSVKYIEPEMPIRLCISPQKGGKRKNKKRGK